MRDPQQRDRQRRIAPAEAEGAGGEGRSDVRAPTSIWTLGLVRDVVGDEITWQRLRYKRRNAAGERIAPVVGDYETYGPERTGYPLEGKSGDDYAGLKWPRGQALTVAAVPVRATWRGGRWLIETFGGGWGFRWCKLIDSDPSNSPSSLFLKVQEVRKATPPATGYVDVVDDQGQAVIETVQCWPELEARHYLPMRNAMKPNVFRVWAVDGTQVAEQNLRIFLGTPSQVYGSTQCPTVT